MAKYNLDEIISNSNKNKKKKYDFDEIMSKQVAIMPQNDIAPVTQNTQNIQEIAPVKTVEVNPQVEQGLQQALNNKNLTKEQRQSIQATLDNYRNNPTVTMESQNRLDSVAQQGGISKVIGDQELVEAQNPNLTWKEKILQTPKIFKDNKTIGENIKDTGLTVLGTAADTSLGFLKGIANVGEGLGDAVTYGAAQIHEWTGNEERANQLRRNASVDLVNQAFEKPQKFVNQASILGETGDKAAEGMGYMASIWASGTLGGGAGTALGKAGKLGKTAEGIEKATKIGSAIGESGLIFTNSLGSNMSNTYKEYDPEEVKSGQVWLKSAGGAAIEVVSENLFGMFGHLDTKFINGMSERAATSLGKILTRAGLTAFDEGIEEVFSYAGNYVWDRIVDAVNKGEGVKFAKEWNWDEMWEEAGIAALTALGSGGGTTVMQTVNNKTNTNTWGDAIRETAKQQNTAAQAETLSEDIDTLQKQLPKTTNPTEVQEIQNELAWKNKQLQALGIKENEDIAPIKEIKTTQNEKNNISTDVQMDLVESAKKYNLKYQDMNLSQIQKALESKGISTRFDATEFTDESQGAKWKLSQDEDGNVKREIILNPNASEKTVVQEMAIHELTHDIVAKNTKTSENLYSEVKEWLENDSEYQEQLNNLKEIYGEELVEEEAIAKTLQTKFGTQEEINNLVNYKPNIARKIYDWVVDKLNKITGGRFERLYWEDVRNKFERAYNEEGNYQSQNNIKYNIQEDSKLGQYWNVEDSKDLFKGIINKNELQNKAYNYILNGNENFETITDTIDGRTVEFKRVSAREYTYGRNNKNLQGNQYTEKMRIAPSIDDLIDNASITYHSPLTHKNSLFPNGFNNYQGKVGIDNDIFQYIVRVGKSKNNDSIFYDLSLEFLGEKNKADNKVLGGKTSSLKSTLLNNSITSSKENVNTTDYNMQKTKNNTQDNLGRKLSKEQSEYFKDSKVRDENGDLLTVFHTTTDNTEQFNEFNPVGTAGYKFGEQIVNFYTDSKSMSGSYANGKYEMVDTEKLNNIEEANQWLQEQNSVLDNYTIKEVKDKKQHIFYSLYDNDRPIVGLYFESKAELLKNLKQTFNRYREQFGYKKSKLQYEGYVNITNPYVIDAKGARWNQIEYGIADYGNKLLNQLNILKKNNLDFKVRRTFDHANYESKKAMEKYMQYTKKMSNVQNDIADSYAREGNDRFLYETPLYNDNDRAEFKKHEFDKIEGKTLKEIGLEYFNSKYEKIIDKKINDLKQDNPVLNSFTMEDLDMLYEMQMDESRLKYRFQKRVETNDIVKDIIKKNKNGSNYDGIIIENVVDYGGDSESNAPANLYITFNSNQFKNLDNITPTSNPDIRYSDNANFDKYLENRIGKEGTRTTLADLKETQTTQDIAPTKKTLNPTEISQIAPIKASTTPELSTKKMATGNKVSSFLSNVTETTKSISQEARDFLRQDDNVKYYKGISNEQSLGEAYDRLQKGGAEETLRWFNQESKKATADDVAEGWILLKQYEDAGDYNSMVEVAKKMREMGTEAGQTVQAFNIMSRLTAEGMVKYQQSELLKMYDEMVKNKTKEWIDSNRSKFELTADETEFILDTMKNISGIEDGYNKKVELAKIQKMINDKLPSADIGTQIKSWNRIAMLFNPKTQVRNVAGNTIIMPVNTVSDVFASLADRAISKYTGKRTTGMTNIAAKLEGFKRGAFEATNDYKLGINTKDIDLNRFEQNMNGKTFNDKYVLGKALNRTESMLNYVMDVGDRVFSEAAYENSIQNQMKLNHTTEITQEMHDIAVAEALQRTWNDNNNYTRFVLNIRNGVNKFAHFKGYGLGDVLIPFAKTPANLTKAIVDYSPAGLVNTLTSGINLKRSLSNGQYTAQMQHQFVQRLGKATAGTMLYILGYGLAKAGIISGKSDDDKDTANFLKNTLGISSYSIKIGDKSFTYDWAQPIAAPFSIMANVQNKKDKGVALLEGVVGSLDTAGSILLEQSFLQSINDVLSDNKGVMSGLLNEALELPARSIPTFSKQIADMVDGTQRQTFVYDNPLKSAANNLIVKIPFASKTLAPSVDTMGREIQKYGGKNNIFNVFLNPANVNTENISTAAEEIYEVYKAVGDKTIMPRVAPYYVDTNNGRINLTPEQRAEYQKVAGDIIEKSVGNMLKNPKYVNAKDTDKSEILNSIVNYSYNVAKKEVLNLDISNTYEKAYKYNKIGNVEDFYLFKNSVVETNAATKRQSILNYFTSSKLTQKQKAFLYKSYFDSKDIDTMLNSKIDMEDYIRYLIQDIKADKDAKGNAISGSKKNKVLEYVNSLNLTIPQKAILIKATNDFKFNDYNNEIVNYVSNLSLSYSEKISLLKELGMTVDSSGNVKW